MKIMYFYEFMMAERGELLAKFQFIFLPYIINLGTVLIAERQLNISRSNFFLLSNINDHRTCL